jgi:hypothetical protein
MTEDLRKAQAEADAARKRLEGTYRSMRSSLLPAAIVPVGRAAGQLARRAVRKRAVKLAASSLTTASRRPGLAFGALLAGALFLFRKPLVAALKRRKTKEPHDE